MASGPDGCGLCSRALDMFVAAYGALAGNLALAGHGDRRRLPGGRHRAQDPAAARPPAPSSRRSSPRGASSPILEKIPVRVILNDRAALLGAARHASLL